MSNLDNAAGTLDALTQQALEWVDLSISGEATEHDADAVKRWRRQSPAHARAFADAVRLRRALGAAARSWRSVRARSR